MPSFSLCLLSIVPLTLSQYPLAPHSYQNQIRNQPLQSPSIASHTPPSCAQQACLQSQPCAPCPVPAPPTVAPSIPYSHKTRQRSPSEPESLEDFEEDEGNLRALRVSRRSRRLRKEIVDLDNKCNNEQLRAIMLQSVSRNIVKSKVSIAERAAREIGGHFDVVCTTGVFSYYAAAKVFCEVTREEVSCFAMRHDSLDFPNGPDEIEERAADIPTREWSVGKEDKVIISRPAPPPIGDEGEVGPVEKKRSFETPPREGRGSDVPTEDGRGSEVPTVTGRSLQIDSDVIPPWKQQHLAQWANRDVLDAKTHGLREETFRELIESLEERLRKQ